MGRTTFAIDCSTLADADLGQIDRLARLQLSFRRRQCELRLANAGEGLLDLIDLVGLAGVLGVEAGREAEEREDSGSVEEEGELHDPTA
jgi:ABC-type transporter Mla MlaB component